MLTEVLAAGSVLRNIAIADPGRRDRLSHRLLQQRSEFTIDLADLVDMLTLQPDARRAVVRTLGEIAADSSE